MRAFDLENKVIEQAQRVHDYLQLYFVDGSILNIFNAVSVLEVSDVSLAGARVTAVERSPEAMCLRLAPAGTIRIGMADADYRGPEALEYISRGPIVVVP